jgi:hypothetical protein
VKATLLIFFLVTGIPAGVQFKQRRQRGRWCPCRSVRVPCGRKATNRLQPVRRCQLLKNGATAGRRQPYSFPIFFVALRWKPLDIRNLNFSDAYWATPDGSGHENSNLTQITRIWLVYRLVRPTCGSKSFISQISD